MGRATPVQHVLKEPKKNMALYERLRFPNNILDLRPTEKQQTFLDRRENREVFYGGSAGGGKSIALLMAALEYVRFPGYAALIIRKDVSRLGLAGGLMEQSQVLFRHAKTARWIASRRAWVFPNFTGESRYLEPLPPASITFGYLSRPLDKFRYASSEFQYIAFDELTDFSEEDYLFLFSRLRKNASLKEVPLRMRSASNPGGKGHAWVRERFIPEARSAEFGVRSGRQEGEMEIEDVLEKEGRFYVPSRIADNPHLDGAAYRESLLHLPPVERERLMNGDWSVRERGQFREEWLRYFVETKEQVELLDENGKILATIPEGKWWRFVTIDPAGTAEEVTAAGRGRTASWSVVQVWDQPPRELSKFLLLRHQERGRLDYSALCELVLKVKREWRPAKVFVEGERLGKALCSTLEGKAPIECLRIENKGKVERATTLITKMERGEVFLPKHNWAWRQKFEAELLAWTGDKAEPADQIDAAAYAAMVGEGREGEVVRVMGMRG